MAQVFFDHNATTPLCREAREVWLELSDDHWFNPSSPYRAAAAVRARLEMIRERLAERLRVSPERLVFNSGATEGNNAVFAHWAAVLPAEARIGVGPTEHPSVVEAARHHFGPRVEWLPLTENGVVDPGAVEKGVRESRLAAVSVMAANNETGVLNPWKMIARICREGGIPYHCDASQWVGKLPCDGLGSCDFVVGCGHKIRGPRGIGFLLLPAEAEFRGRLLGGAQERGRRAGTEDVAGTGAMEAALQASDKAREKCGPEARDAFVRALEAKVPEVRVVAPDAEKLWNTVSLILPEFGSNRWIAALERRGYLVSAGSACSTGKDGPSPVLAAMGLERTEMGRSLRVSSGWDTSAEDWEALADAMGESYGALREEAETSPSRVISI